ncbi:MAG: ComEC/Rec2 family competence protein, partial [Longimicrobiales bacterium]
MRPLIRVTLAFAAGTLAGLRVELGAATLVGALAIACGVACGLIVLRLEFGRGNRAGWFVLGLFAVLGFVSAAGAALRIRNDCRVRWPDGAQLSVTGALDGAPSPDGSAWLRLETVRAGGRDVACRGTVRITLPARGGARPSAGTRLAVTGTWWTFPREGPWPASPEWRGSLSVRAVRQAEGGRIAYPMLFARGAAQHRVRLLFPTHAGVAEALVLATRGVIDADVRYDFSVSGLTHLLSISGTHVALVAGALLLLAGVLRLPHALGNIVAALGTVAYVLFLGAPHPAARAALQILLLLAARLAQRPSDPYTLLAFAGLVLIVVDPLAVLDAGFQLSFAGIFGLLALRRPLAGRLPRPIPRWLRDGLASGTAATLATTPIVALHFGLASWIGIAANLVAIPLVGMAVPAVSLAMLVHTIHANAGVFLASGGEVVLGWLERTAAAAAAV